MSIWLLGPVRTAERNTPVGLLCSSITSVFIVESDHINVKNAAWLLPGKTRGKGIRIAKCDLFFARFVAKHLLEETFETLTSGHISMTAGIHALIVARNSWPINSVPTTKELIREKSRSSVQTAVGNLPNNINWQLTFAFIRVKSLTHVSIVGKSSDTFHLETTINVMVKQLPLR